MLRAFVRLHKWTATGLAVFHCTTWSQTQLLPPLCQIRYHSQCGIIAALNSSERHAPTLSLVSGQ